MKILICDDQALIRDGMEMMLKLEKDIEVVGQAEDGAQAVDMVAAHKPDLVLMDLKMPGVNGIEATRQIRKQFPDTAILVLTTYDDDAWVFDALRAGANGYMLKDTPRAEVIRAVRGTAEGKTFVDPDIAGKLVKQVNSKQTEPASLLTDKLSDREVDVLRSLAKGLTNAEIANHLFLSEGTVRNHVSSVLTKLGLSHRTQAAVLAIKHGLGEE